jgi:hypothetical protein
LCSLSQAHITYLSPVLKSKLPVYENGELFVVVVEHLLGEGIEE